MKFLLKTKFMDEIFTEIKERILQIPDNKGISKEKFFDKLGLSYANFKGKSKKSAIGAGALVEISYQFPDINLEWLITGKGNMIKKEPTSEKFLPFDDTMIKTLEAEISQLKDKLIATLEENARLQKENTRLKDQLATKSHKHTAVRPVAGKLNQ